MTDYILFMHDDAPPGSDEQWGAYFTLLRQSGAFEGGSSIGQGITIRASGTPGPASDHLTGFIRIRAETLDQARRLAEANPVFVAGGTIEIRELPMDD